MNQRVRVIVVINNFSIGGVERLFLDIVSHLNPERLEVIVATVWGSGPLEQQYRLLGIPIYFAAGSLAYISKNPLLRLYFVIISPITFIRLLWLFWKKRPDVVLTCLTQSDIIGGLAARWAGVPRRIVKQADMHLPSLIIKWLKQALAIQSASQVIANSHATAKFLRERFNVPASKLRVIYDGIYVRRFAERSNSLSPRLSLVIGYLGRLEPIKGVNHLLNALILLKQQGVAVPSTKIIGDGSLRTGLEAVVKNHQLPIDFVGEVNDVSTALASVDILVVPSLSEGFGLVILEGLATGKLVIASDLLVIRELITDEVNGYLFPVGDASALANILHRLVTDPAVFNQIKQGVIQWQRQRLPQYDINRVVQRYEQLLLP